jgi:N-acetylmuramoyl-L-alanine amidase
MTRDSNPAQVRPRSMGYSPEIRHGLRALLALVLLSVAVTPLFARTVAQKKQQARTQFETAERMREALNGRPAADRKQRDYLKVMDAYRRVYYLAPTSSKADPAVVAVAELLVEQGRGFKSNHSLEEAIGQYEFLRKEYPGSKYRVQALYTIAQIYKDDLGDNDKAKDTLQEFLKRYPHSELTDDARQALKEIDDATAAQAKKNAPKGKPEAKADSKPAEKVVATKTPDLKSPEVKSGDPKKVEAKPEDVVAAEDSPTNLPHGRSMVTGLRHWSTPDYTRIAIDLENEVKYSSERIANPNRIYFDLKDTRLSSILKGKTFDVDDGYLKKIRVAQFAPGLSRVVLEVGDDVSEYSAFLLPNPYRLVIDIHGKKPATLLTNSKPESKSDTARANSPEPPKVAEKPNEAVAIAKIDPPKKETALPDSRKQTAPAADVKPATSDQKSVAKKTEPIRTIVEPDPLPKSDSPKTDAPKTEIAKSAPSTRPDTTDGPPAHVRGKRRQAPEKLTEAKVREARPTIDGDRSLIRALGLKIGRIVIDAGHGGHDTGTIGPNGMREKDLVLDVALKLGKLLEDRLGAEVVYTRDDDTFIPLETRTAIANQQQADLFISIHANSSDDASARGVETYYLNFTSSRDALEVAARENAVSEKSIHELQDLVKKIALKEKIEESRELAADVQQSLHSGLAAKTPAIRDRGVRKAPFIVLIGANMPSILAEISFISNPTDERRLQTSEYRQKIADSLYKGISKYVGGLSGIKVAAKMTTEPGQ